MRHINLRLKTICCFCGLIILCTLGTQTFALPTDPNNAALLYYQAYLLRPELDESTYLAMYEVLRDGAEPNEQIRKYLDQRITRKTIEVTEAATQILRCDWGLRYSQGFGLNLCLVEPRQLSMLLALDAETLAIDGHYRVALSRCLAIRRLAGHLADHTIHMYAVALSLDKMGIAHIRQILGAMPLDAETLTWLQEELATVHGAPQSPTRALQIDFEMALQTMRISPEILTRVRHQLVEKTEDEGTKEKMRNLTDEDLIVRASEPYSKFLSSALKVIRSSMTYTQKYAELHRLTGNLEKKFSDDPAAYQLISSCAAQVLKFYNLAVELTADINALGTAIEIYQRRCNDGQLPKVLPEGVPKDPFTGRDFVYEITEDGFVLSLPDEKIPEQMHRPYEFKVKK
jgi:hypothetical protein